MRPKLTPEEREILAPVRFSNLSAPYGELVAEAMRNLWAAYSNSSPERSLKGQLPQNVVHAFNPKWWHNLIASARTRWTSPMDDRSIYEPQIEKLRAEAACLNSKGYCVHQCPTNSPRTCPNVCTVDPFFTDPSTDNTEGC